MVSTRNYKCKSVCRNCWAPAEAVTARYFPCDEGGLIWSIAHQADENMQRGINRRCRAATVTGASTWTSRLCSAVSALSPLMISTLFFLLFLLLTPPYHTPAFKPLCHPLGTWQKMHKIRINRNSHDMSHHLDDVKTSFILFLLSFWFLKWSGVHQRCILPSDVPRSPVFLRNDGE